MGLFDRFRTTAPSGQDATRLIEQGHALEAQGKLDEAMLCYLEAIRLAPNPARGHLNRGNVLLLQGDLQGALDAFRTALEYQPDYAGAYYNIGNALLNDGRFDEAAASYRSALKIQPNYAEVHCSLGVALKELGQMDAAIACFRKALRINSDLVEANTNLDAVMRDIFSMANVMMGKGQLDKAVANYRRVLEIKPDFAEAHTTLGVALKDLGQLEEAITSYRHALEIKPDLAEAHNNLGLTLQDLGQLESAETSFRCALEIKPDFAEAHSNLGVVLKGLGQLDGAVENYRRALEIKPDFAEAHNNLGLALHDVGQFESAETSFQRALETKPDFAEADFNLSLLSLTLGRYAEGWPKYEARYHPNFKGRNVILPDVPFPQWRGEPLTGKSLVICPEQGFGDEIQFARYIPMLKICGVSRLTLVCKSPLEGLLGTVEGVDAVVTQLDAATLPNHDYWTFPMSLPLHFATTVETIPAKLPYLSVPPERLILWGDRLPAVRLKVGLVWKGSAIHKNDVFRSLPGLSTLAPLWSVSGITFVSLQKGQGEEEAVTSPTGRPIIHLGSSIQVFADTAAIVSQLDLMICIDTSIAHLAGALGKPCWVLLPAIGTDWRWLRERADSPWYPGVMRLFRQKKPGDWAATIDEVAQALETWVRQPRDSV